MDLGMKANAGLAKRVAKPLAAPRFQGHTWLEEKNARPGYRSTAFMKALKDTVHSVQPPFKRIKNVDAQFSVEPWEIADGIVDSLVTANIHRESPPKADLQLGQRWHETLRSALRPTELPVHNTVKLPVILEWSRKIPLLNALSTRTHR